MFERILVPLDGSEAAEAALPIAALIPSRRVSLLDVEADSADPMRCARQSRTATRISSRWRNHSGGKGGGSRRMWPLATRGDRLWPSRSPPI